MISGQSHPSMFTADSLTNDLLSHDGLIGSEHAVNYTFTNYILQMNGLQQL